MELGDLSSFSEVGVGLFLALAVIQVVGSGGVARLRRKSVHLRDVVRTNRMGTERADVAGIEADLLRLDLQLERFSNLFFKLSFVLMLVSLAGIVVVAIWPKLELRCLGIAAFAGYYLLLPLLVFLVASSVIRWKCRKVKKKITLVEDRIISKL